MHSVNSNFIIKKAQIKDVENLCNLAKLTFLESHGHSAAEEDINSYIDKKFTPESFTSELEDATNLFHLIYLNKKLIGYSKINLNSIYNELTPADSAKLERLYLLQEYHGTDIGKTLMDFNIQLGKENKQSGIWLYVWTENHRANRFYEKYGFQKIAETVFQISERHGNPNWILYKRF